MEVRPGYKLTEVGVIPEEWYAMSLGDLGELTSSKRIFESDYVPVGVLFFRGKEISKLVNGEAIDTPYFISQERYNSLKARFGAPVRGDILITAVGTLGNVYVVDTDEPFYFKDGNLIWLRNIHDVDPKFLGIQLRRAKNTILDSAIGSSQKALTIVALSRLSVAIPRPPEQHAIATALSEVDALLGALDRLIAKKRDLKQAVMQQLLTGQTRLPGFSGEWEVKRLGNVLEKIVGGGTPSRFNPDFWGNEIPWATVKDFATFNPHHTQESITRIGLINSSSNLIPAGTLITSTRMALGKAVVYKVDVAINQDLKALFLNGDANIEFLYYWFEHFSQKIDKLGSGSTVKGISIGELKNLRFYSPKLPEQAAIVSVLSDMDAEIAALEARRAKTRELKQAMMQELLTGKTRLVNG